MSTIMRESLDNVNQSGGTAPDEVFDALHDLMHLYRSQRQRALVEAGHGVSHLEAKTLGFFAHQPDATLSDLAAHSGRDKSQLARLIAGLRDRGLLQGTPDPQDRRNLRLRCTDEAQALHRAMRQHSRKLARQAFAGMDEDERAGLVAALRKLRAALERVQA
jgi:DNA-binding MarR family transcriptional regulator